MTRNAISGRISGTGLISFGDNQICQFESDWAEIFGLPLNTILSNPIWGIDADGNVCRGTNSDDPGEITYRVPTIKETELYCGFRMWDTTTGREVYIQVRDGKFVISEAATPGQSVTGGTWHEKFSFPLAAAAGQNIDLSFAGNALKYLGVNATEDALVYATNPGLIVPSCKVYTDVPLSCSDGAVKIPVFVDPPEWELHGDDQWQPATYPHGIVIPVDGVYAVTAWAAWTPTVEESSRRIELWTTPAANPPVQTDPPNLRLDFRYEMSVILGADAFTSSISGMYDLVGGTLLSMNVVQNSGGPINLNAASLSATLLSVP